MDRSLVHDRPVNRLNTNPKNSEIVSIDRVKDPDNWEHIVSNVVRLTSLISPEITMNGLLLESGSSQWVALSRVIWSAGYTALMLLDRPSIARNVRLIWLTIVQKGG